MIDVAKLTELFTRVYALQAQINAAQKQLRDDPPNDPAEITALITQVATWTGEVAALYREIKTLVGPAKLTPEQLAEAHANVAEGSALNARRSDPTPPATPIDSIYDVPAKRYTDEGEILSNADLLARDFAHGDLVGITKPGVGGKLWKVFRADASVTEKGQAIPADRRFVLLRKIE